VVVVGATVVDGFGAVDGGTVVAATDVAARVVAIASETGGATGAAFLALPPQEASRTSVRTPANVFNFNMATTVTARRQER